MFYNILHFIAHYPALVQLGFPLNNLVLRRSKGLCGFVGAPFERASLALLHGGTAWIGVTKSTFPFKKWPLNSVSKSFYSFYPIYIL